MHKLMLPILATTLCSLLSACTTVKQITVNQPIPMDVVKTGIPTAGAISVDVTPPPGMPMGGYSIMANSGKGFRTRLKARVVYLNDGQGHSVALVQTDLTAGSLLVQHQVVAAVAEKTGLKASDIVITASHSHSAPVNRFENDFYNKHMSNGQGLEEQFLAFVSQRIADGIITAYNHRRPAKVATGRKDIYGYSRNRSLDSYVLNDNVTGIDLDDPRAKFKAINPAMFMIRIDVQDDHGRYKPLAAFSSFSIHATALSVPVDVYNADLFAYAQKDLEWAIQRKYDTPWPVVHGLTNGTQGDMAPALVDQGDNTFAHFEVNWKAAKELGQGIGKEAIELFESLESELSTTVEIKTAARELNIRQNNKIDDIEICEDPAVGAPVAAGAYERRTPYLAFIPFLKGGNVMSRSWVYNDGCQGNKAHLGFKYLQPLFEPIDSFPNTVLFQLIKINDTLIMPLPFEVTTEAGQRMSQRVTDEFAAFDNDIKHAWVAGNANGYFGYTTTPEEYERQNYEGGHTLYGVYTTPYLSAQLGKLARDMNTAENVLELLPKWQYDVAVNEFYPEKVASTGKRNPLEQPHVHTSEADNEEDYIEFEWLDVGASEISLHLPLVKVETLINGQWIEMYNAGEPINDDGYDLEVRLTDEEDLGMAQYQVRWYNPVAGGQYRFVIAPRSQQAELVSNSFTFAIANTESSASSMSVSLVE
ncbi:MAG: neutral/alkaline non-lysosomal ceramidase N-terminal domain-containing protein [Oleispira sp.]|nr:neutral/alkaline non-lysosomal ceramidase N-terminal domain-containing protein [Oleispira sp.]